MGRGMHYSRGWRPQGAGNASTGCTMVFGACPGAASQGPDLLVGMGVGCGQPGRAKQAIGGWVAGAAAWSWRRYGAGRRAKVASDLRPASRPSPNLRLA